MLSIIVAVAENNVIGGDNTLLWHILKKIQSNYFRKHNSNG